MALNEEGSFRVIDVHLSDSVPLDFSLIFTHHVSNNDDDGDEEHQMGPSFVVEESVQQEMKALGLPTCFSTKTLSRRPRRRPKSHPVTSVNETLMQPSLQECALAASTVQLDGNDCSETFEREENACAGEDIMAISRDHQEGKSIDRVCASIADDHVVTLPEASDGFGIVVHEDRVPRDVSTIQELRTTLDNGAWIVYEREKILDSRVPNGEEEALCLDMSIDEQNGEKEAVCSDVSTKGFLELDGMTEISTYTAKNYADENIMASTRTQQESSHHLELTSVEGACVSIVDHHEAPNEEASLLSSGLIYGPSSCGVICLKATYELGTVLNSREPLARETARILGCEEAVALDVSSSKDMKEESICRLMETGCSIVEAVLKASNDGEEAFAILNSRATAQDEQTITLNGSDEKAVHPVSKPRANNVVAKVAEQETAIEDSQILTPEVSSWLACWDEFYGRYYFYNSETLESTWEPPKGFESYAWIRAVEDNNEDGLVNAISNSEELVAKESNEERIASGDDSKSECLLHGPSEVEALLGLSAVEEAVIESHSESLQGDLADEINNDLALKEATIDRSEGNVVGHDSLFCQVASYSSGKSNVIQADVATCKVSMPTTRGRMAARWLLKLENQRMNLPVSMRDHSPTVYKYWAQRFRLFSKYDLGVKLDEEGWFSVTPEVLAKHHAARCKSGVTMDAFTGVGGNAIQFAVAGQYVVAIDNDPKRIEYAHHNAMIYGVADRIDFVLGDFFAVSSSMQADVVFLSPPWGGPDYLDVKVYDILTMLQPKDGISLFKAAQTVASNVILFLPRNVDMDQLAELAKIALFPCSCEVERNYLNGKLKAVTAYYGKFATVEETCTSAGVIL